jgi:hypothetical protein
MAEIQPIPDEVKEAFTNITEGQGNFALVSCVYRGEPNWVICLIENRVDGGRSVTPLFMSMTEEMFGDTENPEAALRAKLGSESVADAISEMEAKQMLEGVERMFRVQ